VIARRDLLLALVALAPGSALAEPKPPGRARAQRRARRPPPPPSPPAPRAERQGEPAPVPNRDIEGPRPPERPGPRLDPALIDPDLPRVGAAADRYGPPARADRLLREPAAGARLRVPFVTY